MCEFQRFVNFAFLWNLVLAGVGVEAGVISRVQVRPSSSKA